MNGLKQAICISEIRAGSDPHPITIPTALHSTFQSLLDDVLQPENMNSPATKVILDTRFHRRRKVEVVVTLQTVCVDRNRLVVVLLMQ